MGSEVGLRNVSGEAVDLSSGFCFSRAWRSLLRYLPSAGCCADAWILGS